MQQQAGLATFLLEVATFSALAPYGKLIIEINGNVDARGPLLASALISLSDFEQDATSSDSAALTTPRVLTTDIDLAYKNASSWPTLEASKAARELYSIQVTVSGLPLQQYVGLVISDARTCRPISTGSATVPTDCAVLWMETLPVAEEAPTELQRVQLVLDHYQVVTTGRAEGGSIASPVTGPTAELSVLSAHGGMYPISTGGMLPCTRGPCCIPVHMWS